MQSDNEKMLQEIVQNTEMGKNTLDELMSLTHDQKLRDEMLRQKREYRRINQAAHTALDAIGAEAHGQSAAARMSVSMGIRTRTMMDKSTRNLATMLAEGSGQGVLDCKRAERDYPEASPGAFKLCHELGAFQSDAEETWRGFEATPQSALRLKHRSGGCGTAPALPKCSIIHKVLSALGLAAAAPRSPYRHLELCGIA